MVFKQTEQVGKVVSKFPRAADVFHRYNIDYCCGGDKTLDEVSKLQSVDVNKVLTELQKHYNDVANDTTTNWNKASYIDLVNHILQAHHAFLHQNLPIISELIKKIVRVHGENHPELISVYQQFQQLKTDLDMHLIKEETIQYPAIEAYINSNNKKDLQKAITIINELEVDHEDAGSILKSLRKTTNGFKIPDDACETFVRTYQNLEELEKNTFTHIHLENNILFPRLKNEL